MTTTSAAAAATADVGLTQLIDGIRSVVAHDLDWDATAKLVADELAMALPHIDGLTPVQRLGSAERYTHHTLYVDPGGQFSILAIVWRPGQHTRIHDHVTWCAFGVLQGVEDEELFDADLNLVGRNVKRAGDVSGEKINILEGKLATTAGTCGVMGTASTMACLASTLGFMPLDAASAQDPVAA